MMSNQRKHRTPIDIVLSRAQNLQTSCFGTPISVTIEASKGNECAKALFIEINAPDTTYRHIITSDASYEYFTQAWGSIKDEADKLLDELVGHHITAKGNLKQLAP